jgi:hypothetical protein
MSRTCGRALSSAAFADVDNNGVTDVVGVSSTLPGRLQLWLRNSTVDDVGECNSLPVRVIGFDYGGLSVSSVVLADVDRANGADLVLVLSSGAVLLLSNNGSGYFRNDTAGRSLPSAADAVSRVVVADVSGDGFGDLVCLCEAAYLRVFVNSGAGMFSAVSVYTESPLYALVVVDIDNDVDLDVVVVSAAYVTVLRRNATVDATASGAFVPLRLATLSGFTRPTAACAADVNDDGFSDVYVTDGGGAGGGRLLLQSGGADTAVTSAGTAGVGSLLGASCAFGDVDNDGDMDLAVHGSSTGSATVVINAGMALAWSPWSNTTTVLAASNASAAALVDLDGDGDLDLPLVGFTGNLSAAARQRALAVAAIPRRGASTPAIAARACLSLSASNVSVVCVPFHGASSSHVQGVPHARVVLRDNAAVALAYDVSVSFTSGLVLNAAVLTALGGVVPLSRWVDPLVAPVVSVVDVVSIATLKVSPASGIVGIGATITVTIVARLAETSLQCVVCSINGVNVSSSLTASATPGQYTLVYVSRSGDVDVRPGAVNVTVVLRDAVTNSVSLSSPAVAANSLAVDVTPPRLTLVGRPGTRCPAVNNTRVAGPDVLLCFTCGTVVEEFMGCNISFAPNATTPLTLLLPLVDSLVAGNSVNASLQAANAARLEVRASAMDALGNAASARFVFVVDNDPPVTVLASTPAVNSRESVAEIRFACANPAVICDFEVSVDGAAAAVLGSNVSSIAAAASALVDTSVVAPVGRSFLVPVVNFTVGAVVFDGRTGVSAVVYPAQSLSNTTTVQYRVDEGGSWRDVRVHPSYGQRGVGTVSIAVASVQGLHTIEFRAVGPDGVPDSSPWGFVFEYDTVPPQVVVVLGPPPLLRPDTSVADFVFATRSATDTCLYFEYQVWTQAAPGVGGWVLTTDWQRSTRADARVGGLAANTSYMLTVRGVDAAGNAGEAAMWNWTVAACPPAVNVSVPAHVVVGVNTRHFWWSSSGDWDYGFEYALDGGAWTRVSLARVTLASLPPSQQHTLTVRGVVLPLCGITGPTASVTWLEPAASVVSAVVAIVSAPQATAVSAFGEFVVNSTAPDAVQLFEYSLDAGPWAACAATFRVGPLGNGPHTVGVRAVAPNITLGASAPVVYSWTVSAESSRTVLVLSELADGPHTVSVVAIDRIGLRELEPVVFSWTVDTLLPETLAIASLPSTNVTANATVPVIASCGSEIDPRKCTFEYDVVEDDGDALAGVATAPAGSFLVPSSASGTEGVVWLYVTAVDVAGNRDDLPAVMRWTFDKTPPRLALSLVAGTPSLFVPLLGVVVVDCDVVSLVLSADEVVSLFSVSLDDEAMSRIDGGGGSAVNVSRGDVADGVHVVRAWAADLAGNSNETASVFTFAQDRSPPSSTCQLMPNVTNSSQVGVALVMTRELPGLGLGFNLSSSPPLVQLPPFVALAGVQLTAAVTVAVGGDADGVYDIAVRAVDVMQHVQLSACAMWLTIDRGAPSSGFAVALPGFTGTDAVTVSVRGSDLWSTVRTLVSVDSGDWLAATGSYTATGLSEGLHMFRVRAVDAAGNEQLPPFALVSTVVDVTPPSVWLSKEPDAYTRDVSAVAVCVLDSSGAVGEVYLDDVATRFNASGGVPSCRNVTVPADGRWSVSVSAVDPAGLASASKNVSFVVDRVPPVSAFANAGSVSRYTNRTAVDLVVSVSDLLSPWTAYFRRNGGEWRSVAELASATVALPEGTYTWELRSIDSAGNVEPAPYATVTTTVDATPPVVYVQDTPAPYVRSAVVIVPCALDNNTVAGTVWVNDSVAAVFNASSVTPCGSGVPIRTDGVYTVVVGGIDAAANAAVNTTVSFVLDREPPSSSFADADSVPAFTNRTSVTIRTAVSDAVSSWVLSFRRNGGDWLDATGLGAASTALAEGRYVFELRATDAAGNAEQAPYAAVTVVVDVTPPSLAVSNAVPEFTRNTAVEVCANSTDVNAVTRTIAVTSAGVASMLSSSPHTTCWSVATAADGEHSVTVSAVDAAGNVATPLTVRWVRDSVAPSHTAALAPGCVTEVDSGVPTVVCPSAEASAMTVACNSSGVRAVASVIEAACFVQWSLVVLQRSGTSCSGVAGNGTDGGGAVALAADDALDWSSLAVGAAVLTPPLRGNGQYRLHTRAADRAGNVDSSSNATWWVDSSPPAAPPTFRSSPDAATQADVADFEIAVPADGSPGRTAVAYLHLLNGEPLRNADGSLADEFVVLPPPTGSSVVQLSLRDLVKDASHSLRVVAVDVLGRRSATYASYTWRVVSTAPDVVVMSQPANVSGLQQPTFVFAAGWPRDSRRSAAELVNATFEVSFVGVVGDVGSWHHPCRFAASASVCAAKCSLGTSCTYTPVLAAAGTYTLQVRARLLGTNGTASVITWTYVRCGADEFAVLRDGDAITCVPCPVGGDCRPRDGAALVTQADVVARAGYWASASSDGSRFYRCPLPAACQPGQNGTRTTCAKGYAGPACSLCVGGFFEQFGKCVACPKSRDASAGTIVAIVVAIAAAGVLLFLARGLLPVDVIKLGLSMLQIIASANSAYDIPWPSAFAALLSSLRVFLVDIVSITQTNCAQPMTYYDSLVVVLLGLKIVLALLLVVPWAASVVYRRGGVEALLHCRRRKPPTVSLPSEETHAAGGAEPGRRRRRSSVSVMLARVRSAALWSKVFKASFMLLFVAYPGVSLKILRLFNCRSIDGVAYIAADMRLRCYDSRWSAYAVYGLVMAALYVVGFPAAVLLILRKRRHVLFDAGAAGDETRSTFGFLYVVYGSTAWWWEVEELLRKLLLSAVVVLIDEGSPLQVTLAVLVSGWAHVLHAMYKPWGVGSVLYRLQHGSLFVTSFVFLMGLLFKVDGVSTASGTYSFLTFVMFAFCVVFVAAWLVVVVKHMVTARRGQQACRVEDLGGAAGPGARWRPKWGARPGTVAGRDGGAAVATGGGDDQMSSAAVEEARLVRDSDRPGGAGSGCDDSLFSIVNPLRAGRTLAASVDPPGSSGAPRSAGIDSSEFPILAAHPLATPSGIVEPPATRWLPCTPGAPDAKDVARVASSRRVTVRTPGSASDPRPASN